MAMAGHALSGPPSPLAPDRPQVVVRVCGVSRYFDRRSFVRALTQVNLEVHRGEVFGLLGPSGSGKSTLIRILAGRLSPSEGRARVFDRPPGRRAVRSRIGYLPQHAADARSQTVSEISDFLKDVFWLLSLQHQTRPPAATPEPNGGRGGFRQVLMNDPELVLLDEPFSGLEAEACDELLQLIRALKQRGRTVILTGSSLTYVKDICDRLAVLHRGQIEALGTLHDLLATPNGLHYLADLLPQAMAEGALKLIRRSLGLEGDLRPTDPETGKAPRAEPGAQTQATPEGVLLPLVNPAQPGAAPRLESEPAIDHELLSALTRNPSGSEPREPKP